MDGNRTIGRHIVRRTRLDEDGAMDNGGYICIYCRRIGLLSGAFMEVDKRIRKTTGYKTGEINYVMLYHSRIH